MPAAAGAPLDAHVLEVLRTGGLTTAAQIAALGLDPLPVRGAVNRLRQRGLVRLAGTEHGSRALATGGFPGIWEAVPTE